MEKFRTREVSKPKRHTLLGGEGGGSGGDGGDRDDSGGGCGGDSGDDGGEGGDSGDGCGGDSGSDDGGGGDGGDSGDDGGEGGAMGRVEGRAALPRLLTPFLSLQHTKTPLAGGEMELAGEKKREKGEERE